MKLAPSTNKAMKSNPAERIADELKPLPRSSCRPIKLAASAKGKKPDRREINSISTTSPRNQLPGLENTLLQ